MNFRKPTSRAANVLLATLIVLAGVGGMMALMSDRLVGTRNLQSVNLARQQATASAEALAALIETRLVQASGDLKTLTEDVVAKDKDGKPVGIGTRWMQQGLFSADYKSGTAMWLGNCLVYWRIEPVKIYDRTVQDDSGDGVIDSKDKLGAKFTNNYEANPNNLPEAQTTWSGASADALNPGYYHFRIITQAFYVDRTEWAKSQLKLTTVNPWEKPEQTIASAQTQRMVQLKLINLFRYVIFYGADGATGDIEINPGADLDIVGAVHSNGAIYLGGQGNQYLTGGYQNSASSGSHIWIGSADEPVTITGIDGIYRTRKVGNYHYQANKRDKTMPNWQDPSLIPADDKDLNGNDATSDRVKLNGTKLTFTNDSRSQFGKKLTDPAMRHSEYVRDRDNTKASPVKTLANIPQLSGYPFESQVVVGQGQFLYQDDETDSYTVRPSDFKKPKQLFYGTGNTIVKTNTGKPIYATDLPMVTYTRDDVEVNDVLKFQPATQAAMSPTPPTKVDPENEEAKLFGNPADSPEQKHTFLLHQEVQVEEQSSGMEARGYYLQNSLFGLNGSGLTGLTIRERGAQNTSWPMLKGDGSSSTGVATRPVLADYDNDMTKWLAAYAGYMARNYVVYFGTHDNSPVDITGPFFGFKMPTNPHGPYVTPTFTTREQFPAWESGFMNRREAQSYVRASMGYLTSATNYQVDVLTLNIARIQALIRDTKWITVFPGSERDAELMMHALFNGMIYAHRTPRLGLCDNTFPILIPTMPLAYHPLVTPVQRSANGLYQFTGGRYPIVGSVRRGDINSGDNFPDRIGDPEWDVWSVFPSPKQVRVINGSTIDWGGVQSSGRKQGLTVVTPNHCYIQGDYNTTSNGVNKEGKPLYPPCGVYADGITMLTNKWDDSKPTATSSPDGDTTTYNVSLVMNNIPTDNENMWDEGSGGTHNLLRFLEGGSREFRFFGSMVVLNRMRYGRNYLGASAGYYGAPKRVLNFNPDLMTAEGQPPFSPWGVQVTRVLSSVNLIGR